MKNSKSNLTLSDVETTIKKFMELDTASKNYALGYMEAMLQKSENKCNPEKTA